MQTYIILATDGRRVMLGTTRPTPDETVVLGRRLDEQDLGGWLALQRGDYHAARGLVMVDRCRAVTPGMLTIADWHLAVSRMAAIRVAEYPQSETRSGTPEG